VFQDHKLLFDRDVFSNVMLPLEIHGYDRRESARRARAALDKVGLLTREKSNPIELSGGEQQRLAIARAVVNRPALLVADEPTAALDVTVRKGVLALFRELRRTSALGLLLVTHDLGLVAGNADRTAVMYAGRIVERGATAELLGAPRHPYTALLLRSLPARAAARVPGARRARLAAIPGAPPSALERPSGCRFRTRCPLARERCRVEEPALAVVASADALNMAPADAPNIAPADARASAGPSARAALDAHASACHFADEVAGL